MSSAVFHTAYIVDRKHDYLWFLGLPFVAVAFAMFAQQHLPGSALVAITLWVTVPHFLLTGVRVYGSPVEFNRWCERLILSPILLVLLAFLLLRFAPLTLVLIVTLWDHQHSFMQQHGFARIYDFKAKAGTRSTKNFDLALNWFLFGNMLAVSPLFTNIWVRMLHEWRLPISAGTVQQVHQFCWIATGLYVLIYLGHVLWCIRKGCTLNPLKYFFLFASYFLWYYTSFNSNFLIGYAVAHRIMHDVQYIAMIYFFNRNRAERTGGESSFLSYLARPGNFKIFLLVCAASSLVWFILTEGHLRNLGFGLFGFGVNFDLFSYSLVSSVAMIHYWYDAFIWKVRQPQIRLGL